MEHANEMKHTFYHGTTEANAYKMMQYGIGSTTPHIIESNWLVSMKDTIYMYPATKYKDEAVYRAIRDAIVCASLTERLDTRIAVMQLDFDDIGLACVEQDGSIDLMGAFSSEMSNEINSDTLVDLIVHGNCVVTFTIYDKIYNPLLRPAYLAHLRGLNFYGVDDEEYDNLMEAIEFFKHGDFSIEYFLEEQRLHEEVVTVLQYDQYEVDKELEKLKPKTQD